MAEAPAAAPAVITAPVAPAAPAAPDNPFAWLGPDAGTLDDESKGYLQNKGWKNGKDAFESYRNLEKLMGADKAGRTVVLPKDDAPAEEWAGFYDKLGRPAADKYQLPAPKGQENSPLLKEAAGWFHEAGLTPKQAKVVAEKWNGFLQAQMDAQAAEATGKSVAGEGKLKAEWGAAYDQNVALAQTAAKQFGFNKEAISALEQAVGFDGVFKLMHNIGSKIGEADFVGNRIGGFEGKMTPEQAKAEIGLLRKDNEFVRKFTSGDLESKKKMQQLHEWAYPPEAA